VAKAKKTTKTRQTKPKAPAKPTPRKPAPPKAKKTTKKRQTKRKAPAKPKPRKPASAKTPPPERRREWARVIQLARAGDVAWLHKLIVKAGYVPGGIDPSDLTAAAAARLFAITPQGFGLWHRNYGCPRTPNGKYDLAAVLAWREQYHKQQLKDAADDPLVVGDGNSATLDRYRTASADIKEFDLAVKRGEFYPAAEVDAHWREIGEQLRRVIELLDQKHPDAAGMLRDSVSGFTFTEHEEQEAGDE